MLSVQKQVNVPKHTGASANQHTNSTDDTKAINDQPLDVAIIIVSWTVRQYITECLRSVFSELRQSGLRGRVWTIDNKSTDGTIEYVRDLFPNVEIVANQKNVGFGAANNQGIQQAQKEQPRYYLLLNPDTLVRSGSISRMVNFLDSNPQVGMVGPRLIYGDGSLQHSAFKRPGLRQLLFEFWPFPARLYNTRLNGRYPSRWYSPSYKPFKVGHPLGAAMLVRQAVVLSTGGFDEAFHMYCEEIDWAWRIERQGWKVMTIPSAEIVHYGGESTRQIAAQSVINLWESRAMLYNKYYSRWKVRLASGIVRSGLRRRALLAPTPELRGAYEQAAEFWH